MRRGSIIAPHRSERRRIEQTFSRFTSGSYVHDVCWAPGDIPHVRNVRLAKHTAK